MSATPATYDPVPWRPWRQVVADLHRTWRQGEHVTIIGPTGAGKSVLVRELMQIRADRGGWVVALGTKPRDPTLEALTRRGWRRVRTWPPALPWWRETHGWQARIILWPDYRQPEDRDRQQAIFRAALRGIFADGGWTIAADELYYIARSLRLSRELEDLWTQGRSLGLTLIGATQRPAWIPLHAYDQASLLFFFRDNDETNLRRVAGLGGLSSRTIRETVAGLARHELLMVDTRQGTLTRTMVQIGGRR